MYADSHQKTGVNECVFENDVRLCLRVTSQPGRKRSNADFGSGKAPPCSAGDAFVDFKFQAG